MIWLWGTTADQARRAQKLREWTHKIQPKGNNNELWGGEGDDTGVQVQGNVMLQQKTKTKTKKTHNAPWFILDRFLNGESRSIATMPILKICTPPPDM